MNFLKQKFIGCNILPHHMIVPEVWMLLRWKGFCEQGVVLDLGKKSSDKKPRYDENSEEARGPMTPIHRQTLIL